MPQFRTPADVGAVDFVRKEVKDGAALATAWDTRISGYIAGRDTPDGRDVGAVELSKNYFDPRVSVPVGQPAKIPWNGFPHAIDRFHQVLASPTPAKMSQAETTADVLAETLFWWQEDSSGKASVQSVAAHALSVLEGSVAKLPRRLRLGGAKGREILISHRQQDEYVEWHADHDAAGRLVRLSFTSEPPEYWDTLAKLEPELVLGIYRDLVGPQVQMDDLFFPDDVYVYGAYRSGNTQWLRIFKKMDYNRFNKWNTSDGAVHLTHPANTLGAEVNLAARAANIYLSDGKPADPQFDQDPALTRIACAGYGGINRSSDPNIGEQVGLQVIGGKRVSLTDPIGLYIFDVDLGSLQRKQDDGTWVPVAREDVLTVVRGQAGGDAPRILHFKLAGPRDGSWTLSDCRFEQRPLERGGQVARKISMVIYADALGGSTDDTQKDCEVTMYCRYPSAKGFFGAFPVQQGIGCGDVKAEDWAEKIPYVGSGPDFLTFVQLTKKAAIDTANAPVGEGYVAPPTIAKSRGRH
ncbi:hypothetical protein J2797_005549 [Paraburkholderia terricola]|uniref:hypothetical protein n=1 Tax=Paraburkholderia terricola TaxID=169427 RepID=UPI002858F104|nr:hypothetical protein [Paraburkholderia terricola]MDR6495625.1 hypothetical protein [Paraburkholderia terricola]